MELIQLTYLYRDASNYKLYGSKVFSNNSNWPIEIIRQRVTSKLIDELYFVPEAWGIERLEFAKFDDEEDHSWHELEDIAPCVANTKPSEDIADLFAMLDI